MAWAILSPPGSEFGPCPEAGCGHIDCARTRAMAAQRCRRCGEPIGYETKFTGAPELAHFGCELAAAEAAADADP